jgi:hypothetical protein
MKRFRSFLIFFIPFIAFFVYFTNQNEHNHSTANASKNHTDPGYVEIPEGYHVPAVSMRVTQDQSGTWLLKVETNHFAFAPEKAAIKSSIYNEGHAHLYINGKKINRLYGENYNLGKLPKGKNEIVVTLNSNNHGVLYYKGQPIQSSIVVDNPS